VRSFDCPSPFKGNVTSTVLVDGRCWYGVVSVESGSNLNGTVKSWPVVVAAAKEMDSSLRSGIRKCDVHPAPSMSKSTDLRRSIFADESSAVHSRLIAIHSSSATSVYDVGTPGTAYARDGCYGTYPNIWAGKLISWHVR
jgi:hypothetical protein